MASPNDAPNEPVDVIDSSGPSLEIDVCPTSWRGTFLESADRWPWQSDERDSAYGGDGQSS